MTTTDQIIASTFQEGFEAGKASAMQSLKTVLEGLKTKYPIHPTQFIFNNILDEIWEKVEAEVS